MVRYIEVENRKGKILRGFLNLPDGVAHPPVVLNLHGFGGSLSGYKYAHTHLARTLEAEGIACMRFDFYGCGESDGEFDEMTFTGLLEDAEDVYAWLKSQSCVDGEKLFYPVRVWGICGGKCGSTYSAVRFGSDVSGSRNVVWMQRARRLL